ncbi:ornithine cyclodeaminase family protein [Kribbella turkmenica]|uniref:ornithine cyclodeaminase family protein n=1 Tax=Kribbella turkmenica TaxID=2530375 RepID=UPI001F1D0E3A|nr:ornithine cyclodeaminase family protein [Kribbella turkmenica]
MTVTLSDSQVRSAVSMPEAIAAVRRGFVDLAKGEFEMPSRISLRQGRFLVMSAHHRPTASAIVKTVSVNFHRAPSIAGSVVWSETAHPQQLIADAAAITTLRTGAAVGVATDLLAPADAGVLTMIGAGAQAPDQIRAVHSVRPLRRLTVVDVDPARAQGLIRVLRPEMPETELRVGVDLATALGDVEIVCCATNAAEPLFEASALPDSVHVNAIGAYRTTMRELPDKLLRSSSVVVDDVQAVLEESGEIVHAIYTKAITPEALTSLGTALVEARDHGPRTVFKTVGVAMQDWAITSLLANKFLG